MNFLKPSIFLAVCIVSCSSQPTHNKDPLPVLKDQPAEVLFSTDYFYVSLLECATENKEEDVIYTWYKFGSPFNWEAEANIRQREGEGSLMFFTPQPDDAGDYQCFAKTAFGTASTRIISLKQTFLGESEVETKNHKPVFGKPYKLECPIPVSYPKLTITWKTQLLSDPHVVEEVSDRRITISPDGTLWFSNITESDVSPSFKYNCVAQTPALMGDTILAEHFMPELVQNDDPNDGELVPQYLSNDMVGQVGNVTMIYCIYGGTNNAV